jgi:hypothetical protein
MWRLRQTGLIERLEINILCPLWSRLTPGPVPSRLAPAPAVDRFEHLDARFEKPGLPRVPIFYFSGRSFVRRGVFYRRGWFASRVRAYTVLILTSLEVEPQALLRTPPLPVWVGNTV